MDVGRALNGWDLTLGRELWLSPGQSLLSSEVVTSRRIGVTSAHDLELRYYVRGNRFVSR